MKIVLNKMSTEFSEQIQYRLNTSDSKINLNDFLRKYIKLEFTGNIYCRKCSKKTKKSFGEGFCYQCFMSAPEASPCILHPELCEAHIGKGRDLEYEERNHNQPHFVYLAATDIVKVGVTRSTQIPTRWIDQGANKAAGEAKCQVGGGQGRGKAQPEIADQIQHRPNTPAARAPRGSPDPARI